VIGAQLLCTTLETWNESHVGPMWWNPPHGTHPISLRHCTTVAQLLCKSHFPNLKAAEVARQGPNSFCKDKPSSTSFSISIPLNFFYNNQSWYFLVYTLNGSHMTHTTLFYLICFSKKLLKYLIIRFLFDCIQKYFFNFCLITIV